MWQQLQSLADELDVDVIDLIREGIGLVFNATAEARATGLPKLAILAPLACPSSKSGTARKEQGNG